MVTELELSEPERRVWEAFPRGESVCLRTGDPEADDPADDGEWGTERQIRAEVLAALLCGPVSAEPGRVPSLRLTGAQIVGALDLCEAEVKQSVRLWGCRFDAEIDLSHATTRTLGLRSCRIHELTLLGADINGALIMNGARLVNPGGNALFADGMTVANDVFCRDGFEADGEVRLVGADIGGQLDMSGATLANSGGIALLADQISVTGGVFCRGFQVDGEVRLSGASIAGVLDMSRAKLANSGGIALAADGMTVANDVFCRDGFEADGEVRLPGADIGGQLDMSSARLTGRDGPALFAGRMTVTGDVFFDEGFQVTGDVGLGGATVGGLVDDVESWPPSVILDGFSYGDLGLYLPARRRLEWLGRMPKYRAQPYEQLAAYYRSLGHDEQARRVLLAKMRARTQERPWWGRWWGWCHDALAGYGYAPGRVISWLAGTFAGGWMYFAAHPPVPVRTGEHPAFNAAVYALDLLLPAPGLGQEQAWNPDGTALAVATCLRIFGWALAIAVAAGITRTLNRT